MKTYDLRQLSGIKFMRIMALLVLFLSVIPTTYFFSLRKRKKKIPITSQGLLNGKFEFFTPYQATVVEAVTSLIIPTDEDPGAREAGVVFELDRIVTNSAELKKLYIDGIEWLDYMAEKIYDKESFLGLSQNEKIKILKIADTNRSPYIYKAYLFIRYLDTRTARRFFSRVVRQTFEVFYTSQIGWKVVGYQGPPQWSGYLDYYKPS